MPGDRRLARSASPSAGSSEPALTAPWLVLAIIVCLLIPGNFSVAGTQMSPNRTILLLIFPFLGWRWLRGDAGGPNVVDVLMLLSTAWLGLALTVNHGLGTLPRSTILCVEIFGGYLVGRMLIRNTADYRRFFVLLTLGFACLLPFAVVELLTGKNLVRALFEPIFNIPPRQGNLGQRLGMTRSQTVFEHPILFGLVASMAVANVLYIWRDKFVRSVQLAAFFVFMVFTTISSGPMLSVLLQLAMTLWDRMGWFLRGKWFWLAGAAALALVVLYFAAEFHILDFIIQNLMFNPQTADGRLVILEYGSAEIVRHPVFGIGLNEWVRPWYKAPSVDNFWLNYAMRFGLPSLVLLVAALAISCSRIAMQSTLTRRERDYRTGYLITLAGITITLGAIYIWSATSVFVWIYIGAGAMVLHARCGGEHRGGTGPGAAGGPGAQLRLRAGAGLRARRPAAGGGAAGRRRPKPPVACGSTGRERRSRSPGRRPACLTPIASSSTCWRRGSGGSFYLLLVMIVVMGILQMLTVASILPLMFVLQHPAVIETTAPLSKVYSGLGFTSHQSFMMALASGVFVFVIFGMVFKAVTAYATYRFTMMRSYTISSRMLSGYLLPALHLVPRPAQRRPRGGGARRGAEGRDDGPAAGDEVHHRAGDRRWR